jgi:hypothetical protein
MGPASDRWKTVENDWEEYNAFISNSEENDHKEINHVWTVY